MAGATGVPVSCAFNGLHWQPPLNATIELKSLSGPLATRTVEPISVGIFIGDAKVGVLRDRGQGQIEAIAVGRQFKPLGLFTSTRAAVAAIIEASNPP
jgi:hypothetical protein